MNSSREAFLQRVREAVKAGNRPGEAAAAPHCGSVGYQGAGLDPVARFGEELAAAGGCFHRVTNAEMALAKTIELVQSRSGKVLIGPDPILERLGLLDRLRQSGVEAVSVKELAPGDRESLFNAHVGISGVDYLIAETGTIVLMTRPGQPRSLSLLPPIHIAVAERSQLLPDLFDLFAQDRWTNRSDLPSCLTLITGPSKTGDIELRLVTGVHGPGEVHVVLIEEGR